MAKRSSMRGSRCLFTGGPTRFCRDSNASLSFATTTEEHEEEMEYPRRAVTIERSARHHSMGRLSTLSLSPSIAAAMLSLPWPPPEANKDDSDQEGDEGSDLDLPDSKVATGVVSSHSKKIKGKKKMPKSSNLTDQPSKSRNVRMEYQPFTTPKFEEVHTNWPGFDHQPISNWAQKYMFARPYQREDDASKGVLSKPSLTNNNNIKVEYSDDADEEGEKSLKSKSTTKGMKKVKGSKPRRRVYVERVGGGVR